MTTRRVVQRMGCVNKGGSMRIADICAGVVVPLIEIFAGLIRDEMT